MADTVRSDVRSESAQPGTSRTLATLARHAGVTVAVRTRQWAMDRPLLLVVPNTDLAHRLGRDFRYPVLDHPNHVEVLIGQGFSCVSIVHPGELACEIIEIDLDADAGAAHQAIAAVPGLDPLKLNADVGTFAWVTDDAGRVLLVHQAYGFKAWGLPGGELEVGETPVDAVTREVREETGYDVRVDGLVAMYGRRQHIGVYFACSVVGGEPRRDFDTEVAAIDWFAPDELPERCSPVVGMVRNDVGAARAPARFFAG